MVHETNTDAAKGLPPPTSAYTFLLTALDSIDQWHPLFERSALGVAMIRSRFHFLTANPAFLTMFGYSSEELQRRAKVFDETKNPPEARRLWPDLERNAAAKTARHVAEDLRATLCGTAPSLDSVPAEIC